MTGLAGAAFATGIGGLWGAIGIGAASNAGTSAFENRSWGNIGLSAIIGGVAAGAGYLAGKMLSNSVFKNNGLTFKDYYNLGRIDCGLMKASLVALRASWYTFLPIITPGIMRGTLKYLGNKNTGEI